MTDVFEEVEEEIRSERLKRLARTWLPLVGGILLGALVVALAWWGWQSFQTSQAHKASVVYQRGLESLQNGDAAGAESAFAEAGNVGDGAYKSLALQQRAGIAEKANRLTDAIALLDQAAKADGDPLLADPARYKAALLLMDNGGALADIQGRLEPLTKEDRPMRALAQEALGLTLLQFNKPTEARAQFVLLTLGQDVPEPVRQHAQAALNVIDAGLVAGLAPIVAAQSVNPPTPQQLQAAAQAQAAQQGVGAEAQPGQPGVTVRRTGPPPTAPAP